MSDTVFVRAIYRLHDWFLGIRRDIILPKDVREASHRLTNEAYGLHALVELIERDKKRHELRHRSSVD
jgi:hypothetical protein